MQICKIARISLPKELAIEMRNKTIEKILPGIPETTNYPSTAVNNLTKNAKEIVFEPSQLELIRMVHAGHYESLIPKKPDINKPNGKLLYNAWATLVNNRTWTFSQKVESLKMIEETLNGNKRPEPLKAVGIMPGQGVNKAKREAEKNKSS